MASEDKIMKDAKKTAFSYLSAWGHSPIPPTVLATLISALHLRPLQPLPLVFPPILIFCTYMNLNGFVVDSAGTTAAFSGLYLIMAKRRRIRLISRFGARGMVRGTAMGVAGLNLVAGGMTYIVGKRKEDDQTL